jgi:hypothetical protein
VHITGPSGCGKTTLGKVIKKECPSWVVFDTDEFIQHDNSNGKLLLSLEGRVSKEEYTKIWEQILQKSIHEFIHEEHPTESICFVGLLDNFAADGVAPFRLKCVDFPFFLQVPTPELLRRYYTRASKGDDDYFEKLASNTYSLDSSRQYVNRVNDLEKWAEKEHYVTMSENEILNKCRVLYEAYRH